MIIETQSLRKVYPRGKVGNDDVSLSIGEGHIFGFLGPNGAGKSTFVKMMVGLINPTSGRAAVLGRPLGDVHARAAMGFLPETFKYQGWLTPAELFAFHGRLLGMEGASLRESSRRVLDEVGLAEEMGSKIRSFSKGMQQRLGLACAMLSSPKLLFLDEPTSALDPIGRRDVRELLVRLRDRGTTVFLNSHMLSEVEMVCDSVAMIDRGRVMAAGTLTDLLSGPCEVEVMLAAPWTPRSEGALPVSGALLLEQTDDRVLFGLPAEDAIPQLVAWMVAEGARVTGVHRRKRDLETLFIETVGDSHHE
jgi:ABC-2 type transport system ATP-binding protein